MPLPLALPFALLVGMSLAWLARFELARSEVPLVLARPFLISVGLAFLVYGPVVGYFVTMHGDWSYLYLVRFRQIPSAVDLVLILVAAAHIPIGFALASPWAIAKRGPALLKLGAVIGALVVVVCIMVSRRLLVSASYVQFHGGFGIAPLGKTALGRGVLLGWLALLGGFGWSAHVLRTPHTD